MVDFKKLFNKDFLKGDKPESEITLKGIEKLAEHYKSNYNFINISIIDENEIAIEFDKFFVLFKEFIIANKLQKEIKESEIINSNEEDTLLFKVKSLNEIYQNKKDKNPIFEEIKENLKLFIKLLKFDEINKEIVIDLVCKKILRAEKNLN